MCASRKKGNCKIRVQDDGRVVEQVSEFRYHESTVSDNGDCKKNAETPPKLKRKFLIFFCA